MSRSYFHYSSLLIWAILRKLEHGMRQWEVPVVYGIPEVTVKIWVARSRKAVGE